MPLFRGLDRIEEASGLYRPITLNMVGLIVESMGGTLQGDPSRLIQTYLTESLTASASRDFARQVLTEMITDAGTKEPHSEAELVDKTQLQLWQVRATLADLARRALVRRLEGAEATWEVAHDFLARAIGQTIGRLKPTLREHIRPLVAPVAVFGWVVVLGVTVLVWSSSQEGRAAITVQRAEGVLERSFNAKPGYLDQWERETVELKKIDERLAGVEGEITKIPDRAFELRKVNDDTLASAVGELKKIPDFTGVRLICE